MDEPKGTASTKPIQKLAGQTLVYGLSTVIPRTIGYLMVIYHTRLFDRAEYGVVTELYAYVTFLVVLLTYGMETGFFRFSQQK
jgi:O-antigen/teichoic acid export membrane protein